MTAATADPGAREAAYGARLLTVLADVLPLLHARDAGSLQVAERRALAAVEGLRAAVLLQRHLRPSWSWQRASAVETAMFYDPLGSPRGWAPGPNSQSAGNTLEQQDDQGPCWLSGGTDWMAFQGGWRCVSEEGIRPRWVTFGVRVATPELSGAFLTLAARTHTWGLADPVVVFAYRGDDAAPAQRRRFTVQSGASQLGDPVHVCSLADVDSSRTYDVAVRLDWCGKTPTMTVYIDGILMVESVAFKAASPIRYAAVYNWRSSARTAFSELLLGLQCPHGVVGPKGRSAGVLAGRRGTALACPRGRSTSSGAAGASSLAPRALAAVAVALVAVAVQFAVYGW